MILESTYVAGDGFGAVHGDEDDAVEWKPIPINRLIGGSDMDIFERIASYRTADRRSGVVGGSECDGSACE